jgi:antitoxin ParD1/3/4
MTTNIHLTPDLERFAQSCVESGRYDNVSEVVRSALRLLEETQKRRQAFNAMLDEATAEAKREGTFTIEAVAKEMDAIIAKPR